MNNRTIHEILNSFTQEHMFSADKRKYYETLIGDFYSVVTMSPNVASAFDKELAGWAVDTFVQYEAIECSN